MDANIEIWKQPVYSCDRIKRMLPLDLAAPIHLHLVRHGETTTNAKRLITGAYDAQLTELGEAQAKHCARFLCAQYDFAFHSGLRRSKDTLKLMLEQRPEIRVNHYFKDPRLNERCLGDFERTQIRHIREYAQGDLAYTPPKGESYLRVAQRVYSFLIDLVALSHKVKIRKVLISGHTGPMRIFEGIVMEEDDPVSVLDRSFHNAKIVKLTMRRLVIPGFLKIAL